MLPLLYRVGPFLIYSYTVVLSLGILTTIGLTGWLAKKQRLEQWFDAVLVCLVFGLLGGRLGFVTANWDYFQEHAASIPRVWQGGYSYFGALFAAILGLWLWSVWNTGQKRPALSLSAGSRQAVPKWPFPLYADLLAPGFALLCAFGWLACWLAGCAYGRETTIGPFAADLPDEFGIFAVRVQTQLMGLVWSLLIFAFAMLTRTRWRSGQLFWLTLGLLSLGDVGLSLLRGDPALMIGSVRPDVILNSTIVLVSAFFVLYYESAERSSTFGG